MVLPEDKGQELDDAVGALRARLKAEWDVKPENKGKVITYAELWAEQAKKMRKERQ